MCLLIIGLVVTGCGSAAGSRNEPELLGASLEGGILASSDNSINNVKYITDANGNLTVTLFGRNFGSSQDDSIVYYNGYVDSNSNTPQRLPLSFINGGTWDDTQIQVKLYKATIEQFPYGSFTVYRDGKESNPTIRYYFGGGNLSDCTITSINPSVFNSYDSNANRYVTITGSGFGTEKKNLTLFSLSGSGITGNPEVTPLYWSNESITFILPDNLVSTTSNIGIKVTETGNMLGTNSYQFPIKYVVFNPTISSVSPYQAYPGQEVTIFSNGGFGESRPANARLTIGNIDIGNIIEWKDYSIRFVIPESTYLTGGQNNIVVNCGNKSVSGTINLIPHITNVTVYKDSGILSSTYYYTVTGYCFDSSSVLCVTNSPNLEVKLTTTNTIAFTSSSDLAGRQLYISTGNINSNYYYLPSVVSN